MERELTSIRRFCGERVPDGVMRYDRSIYTVQFPLSDSSFPPLFPSQGRRRRRKRWLPRARSLPRWGGAQCLRWVVGYVCGNPRKCQDNRGMHLRNPQRRAQDRIHRRIRDGVRETLDCRTTEREERDRNPTQQESRYDREVRFPPFGSRVGARSTCFTPLPLPRITTLASSIPQPRSSDSRLPFFPEIHRCFPLRFTVVGLGLSGLSLMFWVQSADRSNDYVMEILAGFGVGASSIALFARVAGGIYTKAADVGADLVGKVGGERF